MSAKRDQKGQWAPGVSGNPKGRPPGIADLRTVARNLLESRQEELVQALLDRAVSGDVAALKLVLQRFFTAPKQECAHPVTNLDGLQFVPVADVARRFDVRSDTLLRELQRARVPIIYIGHQAQVNLAELEQWLHQKHCEAQIDAAGGAQ